MRTVLDSISSRRRNSARVPLMKISSEHSLKELTHRRLLSSEKRKKTNSVLLSLTTSLPSNQLLKR